MPVGTRAGHHFGHRGSSSLNLSRRPLQICANWSLACTNAVIGALEAAKYEPVAHKWVTDKEMKAILSLAIVTATTVTDVTLTEPAVLLLSGGLLLGLAGAVRRIPV